MGVFAAGTAAAECELVGVEASDEGCLLVAECEATDGAMRRQVGEIEQGPCRSPRRWAPRRAVAACLALADARQIGVHDQAYWRQNEAWVATEARRESHPLAISGDEELAFYRASLHVREELIVGRVDLLQNKVRCRPGDQAFPEQPLPKTGWSNYVACVAYASMKHGPDSAQALASEERDCRMGPNDAVCDLREYYSCLAAGLRLDRDAATRCRRPPPCGR